MRPPPESGFPRGPTHPTAMPPPPSSMPPLPAQLLLVFQGRGAPAPQRRPTMSASPSPPHIMATAMRPAGLSRQNTVVAPMSTST